MDPKEPCITVTGTVYSKAGTKNEPDGDLHFTLQLDTVGLKTVGGKDITTSNNCAKGATNAAGYSDVAFQTPTHTATPPCDRLIVEVICHNPIASSYGKFGTYCNGVNSAYPYNVLPPQGQHLTVSGRLVLDTDNSWNEIHPASYVK